MLCAADNVKLAKKPNPKMAAAIIEAVSLFAVTITSKIPAPAMAAITPRMWTSASATLSLNSYAGRSNYQFPA